MDLVLINEFQNVYSENLCPPAANFVDDITFSITGSGSLTNSSKSFAGFGSSIKMINTSYNTANTVVASDTSDSLLTRALETGLHWLSLYVQVESSEAGENIPFKVNVFKNGSPFESFETIIGDSQDGFQNDRWLRFAQQFPLDADDELTYTFEMGYDLSSAQSNVGFFIAGMSLILNDKLLQQPPYYLPSKEQPTGWASYSDTTYTSISTLPINTGSAQTLTNNAGASELAFLPSGVTTLYSGISNKILPVNVGDFYNISIRFKGKNDNAAGAMDFGIDLGGSVGIAFKRTLTFPKGSAVVHDFNIEFSTNAITEFITNGGIPKLTKVTGNSEVYDIVFVVTRLIKSKYA